MKRHPASYRDPSGYIYKEDDRIYRKITPSYFNEYDAIVTAKVYELLWSKKWLIPHEEIYRNEHEIILKPEQLEFITYPYEWSFTAYKHAAQLTLRIQMLLLEHGFCLKDASAFNVTFQKGKAIFIDTLSIETYKDGEPWKALQQFNEHFLAPLILSKYYGSQHLKTLQHHINGLPLKDAATLLPWHSKLNPTIYAHIHYLGKQQNTTTGKKTTDSKKQLSKVGQLKILKSLDQYIGNLELKENTQWSHYYQQTNYDDTSFTAKKSLIKEWIHDLQAKKVVDLGGNDGTFCNEIIDQIDQALICDIDQSAIDASYKKSLKGHKMTSLVIDLLQPVAAIGFNNKERDAFINRLKDYKADVHMALAIIHHLTISGNVPFEMSAPFFTSLSEYLIIEFPDRNDSWVNFLLDSKREARSLFDGYNKADFERVYLDHFKILKRQEIKGSHRTLYLLQRNEN